MRAAVENGNHKLVKLLIKDRRVDDAIGNGKPYALAVKMGYSEIAALFLLLD